jgi:hypothetical protein
MKALSIIEYLRRRLIETAVEQGLNHPDVISLSQRLDNYLVEYQRQSA